MLTFEASPCSDSLYKQTCTLLSPISSHGLVVKRMTSNHEILGSTPSVSILVFNFYTLL